STAPGIRYRAARDPAAGSATSSSPESTARRTASTAAPLLALSRRARSAVPTRARASGPVVAWAMASRARRVFPRVRECRHTQSWASSVNGGSPSGGCARGEGRAARPRPGAVGGGAARAGRWGGGGGRSAGRRGRGGRARRRRGCGCRTCVAAGRARGGSRGVLALVGASEQGEGRGGGLLGHHAVAQRFEL